MQPDDSNETRRRLAVLEERINSVLTEAKSNSKTLEMSVSASFERLRTDTMRAFIAATGFVIASIGVATTILGVIISNSDSSPIVIYASQPPVVEQPAPAPATPTSAN